MSEKKRIVVDARMIGKQGHGIGNYISQLAKGLSTVPHPFDFHFLTSPDLPADSSVRAFPLYTSKVPFLHPTESLALTSELRRLEPDLYHSPSFSSLTRYPFPYVQTLHDLNHIHFGGFVHKLYYRSLLLPSAKGARALVTVSESARQELLAWLKEHKIEKKITVARNAIERPREQHAENDMAMLARRGLRPEGYYLTISNSKPHKNLDMLTNAYLAAKRDSSASMPPLVITVPGTSKDGIQRVGGIGETEMGVLLRNARAFFFPSLYEGFGRPPVESALSGVPPVVSDIPPHREGLSGVKETLFLSPTEEKNWTDAFIRLAQKCPERVSGISRDWVEREFSVSALTNSMLSVYSEALTSDR